MPTEELLGNDDARTGDIIPGGVLTRRAPETAFAVHLENFEGPFDLLLGLIAKHKLDITEIALAQVTDEFLTHLRVLREQGGWDLSQASEFLLVAATLLDLKSARLLPQLETQDEEDLALIEARDLLFARLLQYRAFKRIAAEFEERMVLNRALVADDERRLRMGAAGRQRAIAQFDYDALAAGLREQLAEKVIQYSP